MSAEDELRTLHRALLHATRAIDDDRIGDLSVVNESLQPLIDAVVRKLRRAERPRMPRPEGERPRQPQPGDPDWHPSIEW